MGLTAKQERNGIPPPPAGHNTALPSVDMAGDVRGLMTQSQGAAASTMAEAHDLMASPAGSGVAGHEIGTFGSVAEWDAGLAINDFEGGGSG